MSLSSVPAEQDAAPEPVPESASAAPSASAPESAPDSAPPARSTITPVCGPDRPVPAACPARGRPRSEAVELAVVEGVLKLLEEGVPLPELSMERIARTAGVGKATLYRRWRDKEELFLDVVRATEPPEPELPGTSVRDDMVVLVDSVRRRGVVRQSSAMLLNVYAQMNAGPRLWREYHERVVEPRRRLFTEVLRRGQETGEIRADIDLTLARDLFLGPILLRTVLTIDPDLREGLSEEIVDLVLESLRPRPPHPPL